MPLNVFSFLIFWFLLNTGFDTQKQFCEKILNLLKKQNEVCDYFSPLAVDKKEKKKRMNFGTVHSKDSVFSNSTNARSNK